MANITIVGDMLCSPRMTKIANGDYNHLFAGEQRYSKVRARGVEP